MVITDKIHLPTEEELTVQELNVSYAVLQAASMYIGKYCEWFNNEFGLCKQEENDPRKCLKEGKALTGCAIEFLQKVKKSCSNEFIQYYTCIDQSSGTFEFNPCRQTQAIFDKCAKEKLNVERPPFGYFCEVKVHDSPRPKPVEKKIKFEDTPDPKPEKPYPNAQKYGYFDNTFK